MKHWECYPFSKHKAETEYRFSVPQGHEILIDGCFDAQQRVFSGIMAEGRLQSLWGQSSLLDGLLSLPPPRGTWSKSPDVVRCSPQHAGLDFASVQFALFEVHGVIGSVSLCFLSGLLQGRHLPCSPAPSRTSTALLRYPHSSHYPRGFGMGELSLLTVSVCTPISAVTSNSLALFGKCQVYKKYVFGIKKKWLQTIPAFLTNSLLLRAL